MTFPDDPETPSTPTPELPHSSSASRIARARAARLSPYRTRVDETSFEYVAEYTISSTRFRYAFNLCVDCQEWHIVRTEVDHTRGGHIGTRRLQLCRCELETD